MQPFDLQTGQDKKWRKPKSHKRLGKIQSNMFYE